MADRRQRRRARTARRAGGPGQLGCVLIKTLGIGSPLLLRLNSGGRHYRGVLAYEEVNDPRRRGRAASTDGHPHPVRRLEIYHEIEPSRCPTAKSSALAENAALAGRAHSQRVDLAR